MEAWLESLPAGVKYNLETGAGLSASVSECKANSIAMKFEWGVICKVS